MGNRLSLGRRSNRIGGRENGGEERWRSRERDAGCPPSRVHRIAGISSRAQSLRLYSAYRAGRDKEKFARVKLGSVEVLYLIVKNRGLLTGWYNLNQMLSKFGLRW